MHTTIPFAALHEIAEVLLAGLVEVAGEVVHDDDVVLAPEVVLKAVAL